MKFFYSVLTIIVKEHKHARNVYKNFILNIFMIFLNYMKWNALYQMNLKKLFNSLIMIVKILRCLLNKASK